MIGRTNTGGGGVGGLNFQVIGGTTAPNNPKENTIWVNTRTKITGWVFSATQPTGANGMVWISTGTSSTVEFNALKKNGIQVYPLSAKQYVSGAWVDKTAKSYQGGAWVEWLTYLYKKGDKCTQITGGWEAYGEYSTVTFNNDHLIVQASDANSTSTVSTTNKIDITDVDTLYFVIDERTSGNYGQRIAAVGISTSKDIINNGFVASTTVKTSTEKAVYKVDVAQYDGLYYVTLFEVRATNGYMKCSEVYF